jgi:sugar phosphate isomerase/epimerase
MNPTRRDFLRMSAIAGSALCFRSLEAFGIVLTAEKFLGRIGISTSITNNRILAEAGYSFVEENVRGFLVPGEPDSVFEEKLILLKESKLPVEACNSFLPASMKCVGPSPVHEEIIKYGETAFIRANRAGIKTIVFGSGGARSVPDGFSKDEAKKQFIKLCSSLAQVAEKYDVVISLEPLNTKECNFVNSVAEGGEIVEAVGHKNFRLLADIYHMLMENESPSNITRYGHLLYHTHIAEKEGRSAPGLNNEDFTPYFKALKEAKYEGRITIECNWKNLEEQAANALKTMRNQINTV